MRTLLSLGVILLTVGCGGGGPTTLKLVGEKCSANADCASGSCSSTCQPWSFAKIDAEIFKTSCEFSSCHSNAGSSQAGNLNLQAGAYAALVGVPATNAKAKSEGKNRVTPNDTANSFLNIKLNIPPGMEGGMPVCKASSAAELMTSYGACMPQTSPPLEAGQLDGIKTWIAMGAPNN